MKCLWWSASLMLALVIPGHSAYAVSYVTVDGHPEPVTLVEGEDVVFHFDVAKPGGNVQTFLARDLAGTGKYAPTAPQAWTAPFIDGGAGDADPAPRKLAAPTHVSLRWPAGPYVFRLEDRSDSSALDLPVAVVPKPQPQGISGRVVILSDSNPAGTSPPDAIIWAYSDLQTPVASAHIQPNGRYSLPLPPGTYLLFAEWFGSRRSQRQIISLGSGQQQSGVDFPLQKGEEVSGTVRTGGQRMADAAVQAVSANGATVSTRTFTDGTYTLVLPSGQYKICAPGGTEEVTVADGPVDAIDFPAPAPAPTPAVGTIITVAGNGIPGFGGDGRPAMAARVPDPEGITIDKAGNLYIADSSLNRIRKVQATTVLITTVAGSSPYDAIRGLDPLGSNGSFGGDGGPATHALFNSSQNVAADATANLYIGDRLNRRVRRVDAVTGVITTVAGNGGDRFSGDGGPATAGQLANPQGAAVDALGNLYIADPGNRRVRKVDPNGILTTVAGGGTEPLKDGAAATAVALGRPRQLAVDGAGGLFIGDVQLNQILKVTPAGKIAIVVGTGQAGFSGDGGPATAAQINSPWPGMAVDSAGNLFFADTGNHRIRKVSPDGTITAVAGSGPYGSGVPGDFAGDGGPATAARLWGPFGVAIDAAGDLLFSDQGNHRIRKVIGIAAPSVLAAGG